MQSSPLKIERGMQCQLAQWREEVVNRQQRLGWKVGFNMAVDQQRLGLPSAMVGYLTNTRRLTPGSRYHPPVDAQLLVEPEVAVLINQDLPAGSSIEQAAYAISAYSAALELVDTTRSVNDDMEAILAGNMFHDSVVLGELQLPADAFHRHQLALTLSINQHPVRELEAERVPQEFASLLVSVANTLGAHGEQLKRGDWLITGAAARPVAVKVGDVIELDMGGLGAISLTIC